MSSLAHVLSPGLPWLLLGLSWAVLPALLAFLLAILALALNLILASAFALALAFSRSCHASSLKSAKMTAWHGSQFATHMVERIRIVRTSKALQGLVVRAP